MKVSMNGLRRQLSTATENLKALVVDAAEMTLRDKAELYEAMNEVIQISNVLNCVYEPGDPEFTDMSDLEVDHLELDGEGQA